MAQPTQVYDPKEEGYQDGIEPEFSGDQPSSSTKKTETSSKSQSIDELRESENDPASSLADSESTTAQSENSPQTVPRIGPSNDSLNFKEEQGKDRSRLLFGLRGGNNRTKGKGKKKALLLGLGVFGGIGIITVLMIILFIIGLLKIPDFASHITEYEFAKVVRTFSEEDLQVTSEKVAVDSANDTLYSSIKTQYQNLRDNTWGKFDNYRPQKVISNMQASGELAFDTKSGVLGRQTITGVTFDGVTHDLNTGFFFGKFHPLQNFGQQVALARDFGTSLNASLRDDGVGLIIRGSVENNIRKKLGISLTAWIVGRYQGKGAAQAELQQQQDAYAAADDQSAVAAGGDSELSQTAQAAATAEEQCVKSDSCLEKTITDGNTEPEVAVAAITAGTETNLATNLAKIANPIITFLFPACMINAGSISNSKSEIDAQNAELQRTFYLVESASDQQKAGNTVAEAAGAFGQKLGDITRSNPEIQASGGTINTSSELSPQASAAGQYADSGIVSIFSGSVVGSLFTHACSVLTSPGGIAGTTLVSILGTIGTAGGDSILDGIADALSNAGSRLVTQFTTKDGLKDILGTTLRDSTIIVGGTLIAKMIVAENTGLIHNGLSTGVSFDNDAEAGAELNSNQVMQQQFYGVPMNDSDSAQSDQANQSYIAAATSTESVGQRYFAFSNPDSLVSRLGLDLYGTIYGGKSIFSSIFSLGAKILDPLTSATKLLSSMDGKVALAASAQNNSADQHYGVVQWGWTPQEEQLIQSDPSYQPLENAQVFTNEANTYQQTAGQDLEQAIQSTYGHCFTDSMGALLSSGDIIRDSGGNVDESDNTAGHCSEANLGPSDSFDNEPQSVFRWRLMQSYNSTLDLLTSVQNPTADSQPTTSTSTNNDVYIVGDSLTVGSQNEGNLQQQMQSAGWNTDQIEATVGDSVEDAIPKVKTDEANVKQAGTVIVALGTNDYSESEPQFSQAITNMVNTIKGINPSAQIYWMNTYSTMLNMDNVNQAIANDASSLGYRIIDWKSEVINNPGKYTFDSSEGIHLVNPGGYTARSAFIVNSLGTPPSS